MPREATATENHVKREQLVFPSRLNSKSDDVLQGCKKKTGRPLIGCSSMDIGGVSFIDICRGRSSRTEAGGSGEPEVVATVKYITGDAYDEEYTIVNSQTISWRTMGG